MTTCDDLLTLLLLGRALDAEAAAHVDACPRCAMAAPRLRSLAARLDDVTVPPPVGLADRVLHAAAPLLARNARRATWPPLLRALGVALLPLPLIVVGAATVLHAAYGILVRFLPEALSFYLVLNYAGLLALLAALTYGLIPVLAAHQARLRHEVLHG